MVNTSVVSGVTAVYLFWSVFVVALVQGEKFFQNRNHADQEQKSETLKVQTEAQAAAVMAKYGYIDCKLNLNVHDSRKRREIGNPSNLMQPSELDPKDAFSHASNQICTAEQTREALRKFQKQFNLPQTGVLDDATRKLMSERRCGNKDFGDTKGAVKIQNAGTTTTKSLLQQVLPTTSSSPMARRRRAIEYASEGKKETNVKQKRRVRRMNRLREMLGMKSQTESETKIRRKRSPVLNGPPSAFLASVIKWRLLQYSSRIQQEDQKSTINLAFRMWSEVIPKLFEEHNHGDINNVDIELAFAEGDHHNCERTFDGSGGEVAHSFMHGDVHFDDSEDFKATDNTGVQLLRVAVHEIGHSMGLSHSTSEDSIMFPIYPALSKIQNKEFELHPIDRKQIQDIYGVCKGTFDTVFDYVRILPSGEPVFNTYFVRGNRYWMYENHANRTRYGDPMTLTSGWSGLPKKIDSYMHVYYEDVIGERNEHFFFAGNSFSQFDPVEDKVKTGYPRLISQGFGPAEGQTEGIPDNIDASFFDPRNRYFYFFKGEYVYVFDLHRRGCCEYKKKLSEEFPTAAGSVPLTSNIDAVYFSYHAMKMYFIKGEDVWENVTFKRNYNPRLTKNVNSLVYVGKWHQKWFDICDTD